MVTRKVRRAVEHFAPALVGYYRSIRHAAVGSRAARTRFGFTLAGNPIMAGKHWGEYWEESETILFLEMLRDRDAVIDIGANVGIYTCLAASKGKRVLSFEPSRRNQDYLYRNLWENGFLDVEIIPVGLSAKSGLGRIYGAGGTASFVPGWAQAQKSRFSLAPLTTLDTVTAGRFEGERLLIKLDVEGLELEVLRGAARTLARSPRPAWLVEILLRDDAIPGGGTNDRFHETFDMFWSCGYKCTTADPTKSPVSQSDVMRWVEKGEVEGGATNFVFTE